MQVIASHKLFKIPSLGKSSINNIFQQLVHINVIGEKLYFNEVRNRFLSLIFNKFFCFNNFLSLLQKLVII